MKIFSVLLFSLFAVFAVFAGGSSEVTADAVSGKIEGGLRILDVESGREKLEFTVYRGDYIVFRFEEGGSYEFTVPELDINEVMPKADSDNPYVKMKNSGTYKFTLGGREGVFNVLELADANYSELTAEEAAVLIENLDPLIIDVRTPGEYEQVHIPGAQLLPVQIFEENIYKLEDYKDKDILLYCASGNRSTVAAKMLIDAEFSRVYNMRRGIGDWIQSGLPVE